MNRKYKAGMFIVLVLFLIGCSQKVQEEKVYRVGVLAGASFFFNLTDGFKQGMAELGYVEGKNIIYDVQKTEIDLSIYQQTLKSFVDQKVDLIYSFPTEASIEAKEITEGTGISVVFGIANIEDNNLVDSIKQPGGHVTGVRYPGPDLTIQRLEILHEIAPNAKKILVAYQLSYPIVPSQLEILRPAAKSLGVDLVEVPAENLDELKLGLQSNPNVQAVLMIDGPTAVSPDSFEIVARFADEHNIPMGGLPLHERGYNAVFGVSTEPIATGKQASILADKVLRGTSAGTIPVVSAESFLEIDYTQAQKLGLTISEGLLSRANKIIR